MEYYIENKVFREDLLFFADLYSKGVINEETLFLLLSKADAEAVIVGSRMGKDAAKIAEDFNA